jgi:hypothetical protein
MRILVKRRTITVVSLVIAGAILFLWTGIVLEKSLSPAWSPPVEIELAVNPNDVIQIGDTMYLVGADKKLEAQKSYDGITWSSFDIPFAQEDKKLGSIDLFNDNNKLGVVWIQVDSSSYAFFQSTYDGVSWLDPQLLFMRDRRPNLKTVMRLNDGTLLVVWNETLSGSKWDGEEYVRARLISYRAYINEKVHIEPSMVLEDPSLCSASGYIFDDGQYIWSITQYRCGNEEESLFRSRSVDGKTWGNYEPLKGDKTPEFVYSTGEVGMSEMYHAGHMYLYKSRDWENWSQEKALAVDSFSRVLVTEGEGELWGIIHVFFEDDYFFSHSVKELSKAYVEKMHLLKIVFSWPSFSIYLVGLSAALWWLIRDSSL